MILTMVRTSFADNASAALQELYIEAEYLAAIGDYSGAASKFETLGTYSDSEMAEHYAANFNAANVCGVNPEDGLNEAKWLEQKEAYEALPTTVQEFLRDSEATSGEMGEMLERYDRVVFLHGVEYDFMGRVDAGKLVLTNTNPIVSISNNSSIIIVAVVSLISLTAIGGFFFYRRRKEN